MAKVRMTSKWTRIAMPATVVIVVAGLAAAGVMATSRGARHLPRIAEAGLPKLPAAVAKRVWVATVSNPFAAGDFTLTDQRGRKISLSQFRGKAVVIEFLDPNCEDICPIESREVVEASRELGAAKGHVVFLAVNVNEYHHTVSDVLKFSKAEGLDKLTNWHFLTGSPSALKAIWKAYGISVIPGKDKDADVRHGSTVYFIDPDGRVRYLGQPGRSKASIADWARAMAYYAGQTLR